MTLLLTGFEPFGGGSTNPSEQAARRLHGEVIAGLRVQAEILPVDRRGGPNALLAALTAHRPTAVICLGQAAGQAGIAVERIAVNLLDYRIADNAGNQVEDEPVVSVGPAAYFATLPVRAMVAAIRAAGVPAELSMSAGTFLCNQVMYCLLHALSTEPRRVPGGFIHLPALPEQAALGEQARPSMSLETILTGVRAAVEVVAAGLHAPAEGQ
jgi:pyroglutamyl-peptidase